LPTESMCTSLHGNFLVEKRTRFSWRGTRFSWRGTRFSWRGTRFSWRGTRKQIMSQVKQ